MFEDEQIRQATFIAHMKLDLALESIILPLALTSSALGSERGKLYFWSGWLLNLIPLAVISYMKAYGRFFCC